MARVVVLAPNWLGDAVLALPAIADVRRAYPDSHLAVAARRAVADLFRLAPGVDEVLPLESDARWWRRRGFRADAGALSAFDTAVLLPNSFVSAWLVYNAGVRERWGYATDARSRFLTRPVKRTKGGHQAEYYQRLTSALGMPSVPAAPQIDVPEDVRNAAKELLAANGARPGAPLVALAPGAAYGRAKQWIPSYVAKLIARLTRDGVTCAMLGSRADRDTVAGIRRELSEPAGVVDLAGQTSLELLAGVLATAAACVCNDSGAMHLAAAVGTPVVATFGPTNEHATRPLARDGHRADVLTHDVWCRPCMLRECPIDHRCMTGITPDRVHAAVTAALAR